MKVHQIINSFFKTSITFMKSLIFSILIVTCAATQMQAQIFMTRTGKIFFDATTKTSPEKIEGKNNEVACIVDSKTGDMRFQVPIKSFKFERQLMEEHFNENYMESDKFPKSEFKGTITNLNEVNFSKDGTYTAHVTGKLTMHGVTNDVTVTGTITVKGNSAELKSKFSAKLADYKIEIPGAVGDKIDKVATITINGELNKK